MFVSVTVVTPISIHAPARGATGNLRSTGDSGKHFNPRSREGSDRHQSVEADLYAHFNPRSREGSDDDGRHISNLQRKFQSTLPRGERRRLRLREHGRKSISIHAPARGATFCHLLALLNTRNFNPRSREGSDGPSDVTLLTVPVFQSTLPRGERLGVLDASLINFLFQSTLPRGERLFFQDIDHLIAEFQSTLPRGERLTGQQSLNQILHFNPRSREGSD